MKTFDFRAVYVNQSVLCVEHFPLLVSTTGQPDYVLTLNGDDPRRDDVQPIFAGESMDYYPVCDSCGKVHDYVSLTSDGEAYQAARA